MVMKTEINIYILGVRGSLYDGVVLVFLKPTYQANI